MRKLAVLAVLLAGCSGGGFEARGRASFEPLPAEVPEADSGATKQAEPMPSATATVAPLEKPPPVVVHECPQGYDWNEQIGHCLREPEPPQPEPDGGSPVVVPPEEDAGKVVPPKPTEPDATVPPPPVKRTCIEREPALGTDGGSWVAECCIGQSGINGQTPGSPEVKRYFELCGPNGLGHATCHGVCDASQAGPECTKIDGTARQYSCP